MVIFDLVVAGELELIKISYNFQIALGEFWVDSCNKTPSVIFLAGDPDNLCSTVSIHTGFPIDLNFLLPLLHN